MSAKLKSNIREKEETQLTFGFEEEKLHPGYSTDQAIRITKITNRQLNYWTKKGIVKASVLPGKGSGTTRHYSYLDILEINLVNKLLEMGLSLKTVEENFAYVRDKLKLPVYNSTFVMADGQPAVVTSEKELLTLASRTMKSGMGQGMLNLNIFNLSHVKKEVDKSMKKLGFPQIDHSN